MNAGVVFLSIYCSKSTLALSYFRFILFFLKKILKKGESLRKRSPPTGACGASRAQAPVGRAAAAAAAAGTAVGAAIVAAYGCWPILVVFFFNIFFFCLFLFLICFFFFYFLFYFLFF